MKEIKKIEDAIRENTGSFEERGINPTMFWAYRSSRESGNELLDFSDVIWEREIEGIAGVCRELEITEFTISSTVSGLVTILAEFEKHGCIMAGITQVRKNYRNWETMDYDFTPAIKMEVK